MTPTGMMQLMPKMDDGPTDGPPGRALQTVSVELSADEAYELLESLKMWAEEVAVGNGDPGCIRTSLTGTAGS
jgi:hypothetical protein